MLKKRNIRNYYEKLTQGLKKSNPRNFYKVAKQISDYQDSVSDECEVEQLASLSEQQAAEQIANHFAAVSCSYQPVSWPDCLHIDLPSSLPR